MFAARLNALLAARGIHYGWVVAATTFLTMLATAGAMGSAGVLILPLEQEFGWSNAEISTALALRLALFGVIGPFAAAFMNRFGLRMVTAAALSLIGGGVVLSFWMTELWQMVALWGVVVGVGTGLTALVLGATVATRWFDRRRGLVVGLMTASNATGQLVFLPVVAALTEAYGWRSALTLTVAALAVALVLVLALLRDRPADLGLPVYGQAAVAPVPPRPAGLATLVSTPIATLRDVSGTRTFWILFATFFICGFSTNGLIQTHWIALCGDYGIAATAAAGLLAAIGVFDLVGTIGSGWLSDRFDNRWLLFWYYGLRGLSLAFLPFSDFSQAQLALFAVFYGLDWVATVPPTVKLTAERFGPERAPLVFGWIFAAHQVGAATAAWTAGSVRTGLGDYAPSLYAAGMLCLVAAGLALSLGRPNPGPLRAPA